jgi:predicted dehydrogenase
MVFADSPQRPPLRIGMVGYAFMGAAHSQAWRTVNRVYDLPLQASMVAVAGRTGEAVRAAAARLGWAEAVTDWRELLDRTDIDLIDICTPGDSHAEIAIAALRAGKHVLCEKPLANSVPEAEAMAEAATTARAHGVRSACGYNYRRVPAVTLLRDLVAAGRLGEIRHVRAVYLQDWITDPQFPLVWRLQKDRAGSGALGDIGAHVIDLARFLVGEIAEVTGDLRTFIRERPLPGRSGRKGAVTVDDASAALVRFANGAMGTIEATRLAPGRKNANRFEINGSRGSLAFDLERMNELELYLESDRKGLRGFRTILVTEAAHPFIKAWWPPGHIIGYEHTFTHTVYDLLEAVADTRVPAPSFQDGLRTQLVMDAIERSARTRRWVAVQAG